MNPQGASVSFLRVRCPHCRAVISVANTRGTQVLCPTCHHRLVVPAAAAQQTDPPTTPVPVPRDRADDSSSDIFAEAAAPPANQRQGPLSMKGIQTRPQRSVTLGDYQVLKKLGNGAMGAVYLARQRSLDRLVALKVLSSQLAKLPGYVERFYREARLLATLQHPGIVQLFEVGEERSLHYFAMEVVDGFTLAALLQRRGGRFAVGDALHIALRCAEALRYAHERNVVHRDVKPANVLVTRLGEVKLTDLGLAKPMDEDVSLTASGVGAGTPQYMAPEQGRSAKHADHRSDIYSLGCVLYRMATGALPFQGEGMMELLLAKEQGLFPSARRLNPEVPGRLDLLIDKMLARDPALRYQDCASLIGDLEGLQLANPQLSFNPLQVVPAAPAPAPEPAASERVEILLIHDDAEDIGLAQEALKQSRIASNLSVVGDGRDALAFLNRQGRYRAAPRPTLILLGRDLLDRDGLDTIRAIKTREAFRRIPLVVLTTSDRAVEVLQAHGLAVNLTVVQPGELKEFQDLIDQADDRSTLTVVQLPRS